MIVAAITNELVNIITGALPFEKLEWKAAFFGLDCWRPYMETVP